MSRERSLIIIGGALRVVFGGMLMIAGREKLIAFGWWRQNVHALAFVPDTFEGVAAAVVPGVEIVTAIAILLGLWLRPAAALGVMLFLVFALVRASVIWRGIDVECGCFGPESDYPVTWATVAVNLLEASLVALLVVLPPGKATVDEWVKL